MRRSSSSPFQHDATLCPEWRPRLEFASERAARAAGFDAGNVLEFDEAQLTVALLCGLLGVAWLARSFRHA